MPVFRLAAFDLDGTLAPVGGAASRETVAALHELEEQGYTIAVCSGKPTYYLCGYLRQLGLKHPVMVGENGAAFQIGVELPPKHYRVWSGSKEAQRSIRFLKEAIDRALPNLFYQPNQVGLTPFPKNEEEFSTIQSILEENKDRLSDVEIYRHFDSFDIMPVGISKYAGLEALGRYLNIPAEETVAVGDGINDYPMFRYAGFSIGIGIEAEAVDRSVERVEEALEIIGMLNRME